MMIDGNSWNIDVKILKNREKPQYQWGTGLWIPNYYRDCEGRISNENGIVFGNLHTVALLF
jgi:hypothetical protein